MNSTRFFYKFLIFVVFTFTLLFAFLVFLPQRKFALAGCSGGSKQCDTSWGWVGFQCDPHWGQCDDEEDTHKCYVREGYCFYSYTCDCKSDCCGDCFVEGTSVASEQLSDQAIENLEPGEIVSSFNPETGEISESQVSEVHKLTREGYYELETESGKKVKVTGEHPLLAIKGENDQAPNSKYQIISKFKNVLSNTLTYRLITSLKTKLIEILD